MASYPFEAQPNESPALHQNGSAVARSSSPSRKRSQFMRQGSSYGSGHVHNMAVMLAPTRIDYSFNRGGLKLWLVLVVFILLLTSILSIFSEENPQHQQQQSSGKKRRNKDEEHAENGLAESMMEGQESPIEEIADATILEPEPESDDQAYSHSVVAIEAGEHHPGEEEESTPSEDLLFTQLRKKVMEWSSKLKTGRKKKPHRSFVDAEEDGDAKGDDRPMAGESDAKRTSTIDQPPVNTNDETPASYAEEGPPPSELEEESAIANTVEIEKPLRLNRRASLLRDRGQKLNRGHDSIQAKKLLSNGLTPRKNLLKHKKPEQLENQGEEIAAVEEIVEDNEGEVEEGKHIFEDNMEHMEADHQSINADDVSEVIAIRSRSTSYNRKAITSRDDYRFRKELDAADFVGQEKHDFDTALKIYDRVLALYPHSPRAHFGKGRIYQLIAEFDSSRAEEFTDKAIHMLEGVVGEEEEVPQELFKMAAHSLITSARRKGDLHQVLATQRALIDKSPEMTQLHVDFAATLLAMSRIDEAREILTQLLDSENDLHDNRMAHAYYGYLLKVYDRDIERGVMWMRKAIEVDRGLPPGEEPLLDPKFYYHLGDGLLRLRRRDEAHRVYERAVAAGIFPSIYQRSIHNLVGLKAQPWWNTEQSGCSRQLKQVEHQWTVIRREALKMWNEHGDYGWGGEQEADGLKELVLWRDRRLDEKNCEFLPQTCEILSLFAAQASCLKGEAHLGLVVASEARIRVAKEMRGWREGKFLIFSNSFEHEITFEGAASNTVRLVLIINMWHPEVPTSHRPAE